MKHMKKILILVIALVATVQFSIAQTATEVIDGAVAVAQTTENVSDAIDATTQSVEKVADVTQKATSEAERLVDKYGGKISAVITSLAESLKVSAEHVYRVLVRQQIAEGASVILLLVFWIFLARSFWKNFVKANFKDREGDRFATVSIILGIASAVLGIILIFFVPDAVIKLINPEYGAIKEIFELVQTMQ